MDRFLAVLSLALAVGSLVPAFTATNTRMKIVGGVISVLLIGVVGTQLWSLWAEGRHLIKTKEAIERMFDDNNPMSFEQIAAHLKNAEYTTAAMAVDELVDEHKIRHRPVDVTSANGAKYVVRVYNSVNFSIP